MIIGSISQYSNKSPCCSYIAEFKYAAFRVLGILDGSMMTIQLKIKGSILVLHAEKSAVFSVIIMVAFKLHCDPPYESCCLFVNEHMQQALLPCPVKPANAKSINVNLAHT